MTTQAQAPKLSAAAKAEADKRKANLAAGAAQPKPAGFDFAPFAKAALAAFTKGAADLDAAQSAMEEAISLARRSRARVAHDAATALHNSLQGCQPVTLAIWKDAFLPTVRAGFAKQNEQTADVRAAQLRPAVIALTHGMALLPWSAEENKGDSLKNLSARAKEFLATKTVEGGTASNAGGAKSGKKLSKGTAEYLEQSGMDREERVSMFHLFGDDEDQLLAFCAVAASVGRGPEFARVMLKVTTESAPRFIQTVQELANLDKATPKTPKMRRK